VDGLHRRAGTSDRLLVEVHGTDLVIECQRCHATSDPPPHLEAFMATRKPPGGACGGVVQAAAVSFRPSPRPAGLQRAAAMARKADLMIALGSTLSVYPAASLPLLAAERGAPYVIVNRGVTDHDTHPAVTLRLEGDVTAILPAAVELALAS